MGKKIRLLIVDDDLTVLKLMANAVSNKDFEISTLINADNIVKDIKQFTPDIVLLDIKMPGVTGVEAIKLIKADNSINEIPVIAFTSYSMKGDKDKFLKMGYNGYIPKPIDTRTITDQIMEELKRK